MKTSKHIFLRQCMVPAQPEGEDGLINQSLLYHHVERRRDAVDSDIRIAHSDVALINQINDRLFHQYEIAEEMDKRGLTPKCRRKRRRRR